MRRKSQVTMFIIMAIVVFIFFAVYHFISGSTLKGNIGSDEAVSEKFQENIRPVESFIVSCMEQVGKKGLDLAGKQGGAIWANPDNGGCRVGTPQNGPLKLSDVQNRVVGENYCIRYGIIASPQSENSLGENEPTYPWLLFPMDPATNTTLRFTCNICGISILPKLEEQKPDSNINDIERVLETYIDGNIQDSCLSHLQSFKSRFEITEQSATNTSVTFRDNEVLLKTNYPIQIYDNATKQKAVINTHKATIPVRFGKLYKISEYIIKGDIENINFDIANPSVQSDWEWIKSPDFSISKYPAGKYDLISVEDKKSKDISGNPFRFTFARENRRPALWYINNTNYVESVASGTNYRINKDSFVKYFKYAYCENEDLKCESVFSPDDFRSKKIADPDEDVYPGSLNVGIYANYCGDEVNILEDECVLQDLQGGRNGRQENVSFRVKVSDEGEKGDVQGSFFESDLFMTLDISAT